MKNNRKKMMALGLALCLAPLGLSAQSTSDAEIRKQVRDIKLSENYVYAEATSTTNAKEAQDVAMEKLHANAVGLLANREMDKKEIEDTWQASVEKCQLLDYRNGTLYKSFVCIPKQALMEDFVPNKPAEPAAPETPAQPAVAETPAAPEAPAAPDTPVVAEVPATPAVPDAPQLTTQPETPAAPETPAVPETPAAPETPVVAEVPATPEVVRPVAAPDTPEVPAAPEPVATTDAPVLVSPPVPQVDSTATVSPAATLTSTMPAAEPATDMPTADEFSVDEQTARLALELLQPAEAKPRKVDNAPDAPARVPDTAEAEADAPQPVTVPEAPVVDDEAESEAPVADPFATLPPKHVKVLKDILSLDTYESVMLYLSAMKEDGRIMYGPLKKIFMPERAYLIIIKQGKLETILNKGTGNRVNLKTFAQEPVQDYTGQGIIWLQIFN